MASGHPLVLLPFSLATGDVWPPSAGGLSSDLARRLPCHIQNIRTTEERIRASWLCSSLVALGNGIPFFHAGVWLSPAPGFDALAPKLTFPSNLSGDELLRSKSLDRDSYNSGDWFNRCRHRL